MKTKRKPTPWREIASQLARAPDGLPPRAPEAFWREFHQRRSMVPHVPPRATVPRMPWFWALGGAGAAAGLAVVAFMLFRPAPAVAETQVHSYHVAVPHSSVMLWRDEPRGATILWVSENEN